MAQGTRGTAQRARGFRGSNLRRLGVGMICAKLFLVPLLFDVGSDIPFAVVKGLVSHALAYALAGVILGLVVLYGRSAFVWTWLHVPVLVFLAVNLVATIFAAETLLALYGARGLMVGLGTIADGVLLYAGIVMLIRTRADAIAVLASGFGAAILVLAYEGIQFFGRDPFAWNVTSADRPFSTLGQSTSLAEYLAVVMVGAAAIGLLESRIPRLARGLLLLVSALSFAGLVVTRTRSALIGVVLGVAVLVLLTWFGHPSRPARLISLVGAILLSAAFGLVLFFTPLGARILTTVDVSASADAGDETGPRLEQSSVVRLGIYQVALEMVKERPLLGFGPDNFGVGFAKYRTDSEPDELEIGLTTSAHGWVSQIASSTGVLGLAAFAAVAIVGLWLTLRSGFHPNAWAGAGMAAAFLGAGLTTVNAVSTEWLFWAAVGAIGAATGQQAVFAPPTAARRRSTPSRPPTPTMPQVVVAVSFVILGAGLALTAGTALAASHAARESQRDRLSNQSQQAIDAGLRATALDPLRAYYWDTLGLAYVSADRSRDAIAAFDRAAKLAPYDVRYSGDLARAYVQLAQRGDTVAGMRAREIADAAIRIDPNNPLPTATRAVARAVTGDLPEAVRSIER